MANEAFNPIFSTLLERERTLRRKLLNGPDYFSCDLTELEEHHANVADELTRIQEENRGWPGILSVGLEGAQMAAELVRFCWSEPAFMRNCLPLIEHGYRFGEGWGIWFAQLYDAVMHLENKPQVYGFALDWNARKELRPWKLVDRGNVHKRRSALQVEPLAEYVKRSQGEARASGMLPPVNLRAYRKAFHDWTASRGWKRTPPSNIPPGNKRSRSSPQGFGTRDRI